MDQLRVCIYGCISIIANQILFTLDDQSLVFEGVKWSDVLSQPLPFNRVVITYSLIVLIFSL